MWPQDPLLWECCINHLHRLPGWVQLDLGGRPLGQPPRGVSRSLPHNPQEPMAAIHSRSCQVHDSLPQQERHFLREDPVFSPQVGSTIYHLPKPFLHRDSFPEYSGHFCDPIEAKEFILDLFSPPGERRSRWHIIGWNDIPLERGQNVKCLPSSRVERIWGIWRWVEKIWGKILGILSDPWINSGELWFPLCVIAPSNGRCAS